MNTPGSELENSGGNQKVLVPATMVAMLAGGGYAMLHHADKNIDAAIGKQKNEEAVRKALKEAGVEKEFCGVCEDKDYAGTPIEKLPLQPIVDTKNRVMKTLGHNESDLRLTCESFPEGRKAIGSWNDSRHFDAKRVPFCNQTRRR